MYIRKTLDCASNSSLFSLLFRISVTPVPSSSAIFFPPGKGTKEAKGTHTRWSPPENERKGPRGGEEIFIGRIFSLLLAGKGWLGREEISPLSLVFSLCVVGLLLPLLVGGRTERERTDATPFLSSN